MKHRISQVLFFVLLSTALHSLAFGWWAAPDTAAQSTGRAATRPSFVLMGIAAHPDDEDAATLAYYSRLENVTTYSIFFTRGEGGQNETGSELYGELGEVRTHETLEAASIIGTQVGFLGFPDFGFSKTATETFARWGGKDSVLARLVYVIRSAKPDVIITNHDTITTKPSRQHGNHQAAGITSFEAFRLAADPTYHPEQFGNGVTPWQVKKLYFRYRSTADSTSDSVVTINVKAEYTPAVSIEDLAVQALAKHRSQGFANLVADSLPPAFRLHRYQLVASAGNYDYNPADLFSGLKAESRISRLPEFTAPVLAAQKLSLTVTPLFTSFGVDTARRNATHRRFVLRLNNTTGKNLRAEVLGTYEKTRIFQKAYAMTDSAHWAIADTIELTVDHGRIGSEKSIRFLASASGKGIAPLHLLPPTVEVAVKPMPGVYTQHGPVGLVRTYDNTLEETMQAYGIKYALLDSTTLASGNLDRFPVIILDLRFGEFRTDAVKSISRLLDYARSGGNLVAMYNKPGDWNGKGLAPFPITLTAERVTEEDAEVTELLPGHRLLTVPNVIGAGDWSGWVQERSVYLPAGDTTAAKGTAVQYQRLLAMHDKQEEQPSTSLLWAKTGTGTYTYIALALYRQLRILQPGAVRLFFNLISQERH